MAPMDIKEIKIQQALGTLKKPKKNSLINKVPLDTSTWSLPIGGTIHFALHLGHLTTQPILLRDMLIASHTRATIEVLGLMCVFKAYNIESGKKCTAYLVTETGKNAYELLNTEGPSLPRELRKYPERRQDDIRRYSRLEVNFIRHFRQHNLWRQKIIVPVQVHTERWLFHKDRAW